MKVFLDDIRKWKNEFQKDEKKPSTLSSHELHSYHTVGSQSLERATTLENVATKMCNSCGKIKQTYQVALRKHQLPLIYFEEDELTTTHKHLYVVDELHEKLKAKIHNVQDPSEEVINKYVVDTTYSTVQLSMFVSTMIESTSRAFKAKINCECK